MNTYSTSMENVLIVTLYEHKLWFKLNDLLQIQRWFLSFKYRKITPSILHFFPINILLHLILTWYYKGIENTLQYTPSFFTINRTYTFLKRTKLWPPSRGGEFCFLYVFTYRVTGYKWSCFPGTSEKVSCPIYTFTVAYTRQVTFYKVPEKHSHV